MSGAFSHLSERDFKRRIVGTFTPSEPEASPALWPDTERPEGMFYFSSETCFMCSEEAAVCVPPLILRLVSR